MIQRRSRSLLAFFITILLAGIPATIPDGSMADQITSFSDASLSANITFGPGGGWNNSTSVKLPAGVNITSANITLASEPTILCGIFETVFV